MVGAELLAESEYHARLVKDSENMPWGGLSVVVSGDFAQLPPVKRTSLASSLKPLPD